MCIRDRYYIILLYFSRPCNLGLCQSFYKLARITLNSATFIHHVWMIARNIPKFTANIVNTCITDHHMISLIVGLKNCTQKMYIKNNTQRNNF